MWQLIEDRKKQEPKQEAAWRCSLWAWTQLCEFQQGLRSPYYNTLDTCQARVHYLHNWLFELRCGTWHLVFVGFFFFLLISADWINLLISKDLVLSSKVILLFVKFRSSKHASSPVSWIGLKRTLGRRSGSTLQVASSLIFWGFSPFVVSLWIFLSVHDEDKICLG